MNKLKGITTKIYIKFQNFKFRKMRKLGEAIKIIKHVSKTKEWPHGDEEYQKILQG